MRVASEQVRPGFVGLGMVPTLVAAFLLDAVTMMVVVAYGSTFLLNTLHAPPSYPGYALALYGLVKLAGALVGGWALERIPALIATALIVALELGGLLVMLLSFTANGFLVGVVLLSSGVSIAWLVVYLAAGDRTDGDGRGLVAAYLGMSSAAASGLGIGLAALLNLVAPWRAVFLTAALLAALGGLALATIAPAAERALRDHQRPIAPVPARDTAVRRPVVVLVFAHYTLGSAVLAAYAPLALRALDLTLARTLFAVTPAAMLGAAVMFASGRRSSQGSRLRHAATFYLLAAGGAALGALAMNELVFALAAAPLAAGMLGSLPLINAGLIDQSRSVRRAGAALGLLFFAEGLGSVAGPALVAVVVMAANVRFGVGAVGVSALVLAVLAWTGSKRGWL